jgi:DEAD/DEAH box helicase domain-containing protein
VLVASSAPLDQFIVRHPDYFFGASPEQALVNPDNLQILLDHIKCAAFELPFTADERFGQEDLQAVLGLLGEEGFVHGADGQWNWTHESYPADAVSLRSVSSDNVVVIDVTVDPQVIAETDFTSAPSMLHEKAIYILEGQLFHVERFDFDHRKAYVKRVDCDYYTDAIKYSKVTILDERSAFAPDGASTRQAAIPGAHGEVHVVARVIGFKKIRFYTNENVGSGELDLPEQQMHTTSYWLTIPPAVMASLPYDGEAKRDGVSGLATAMRTVAQLLLMCDQQDLGVSVNAGDEPATSPRGAGALAEAPTIFLYDNYPGGIGFSAPLFEVQDRLLEASGELIAGCSCATGCPSCVGPIGEIGPQGKRVALDLLARLTGRTPAAAPVRASIEDGEVPF